MSKDAAKYESYRNLIEKFIYLGGIWPHSEGIGLFYKLIAIIGAFLSSTHGLKILVHTLSNIGNMSAFVAGLQDLLVCYAILIKIVTYTVHRSELVWLDKEIGKKFEEELKNEKNQPALLKKISLYSKFLYILTVATFISSALYWIPLYVSIFKYKNYRLQVPGKYPFSVKPKSPLYWTMVIYESSMCWYSMNLTSSVDSHFGLHCFRISGLLRLAAKRFEDLNVESPNCSKQLRECVVIHQLVLRSKLAMQETYGVIIMWNYLTSTGLVCAVVWQACQIKSQLTVYQLIFYGGYVAMKLVQSFINAYYGSGITSENENYQEAIYNSNWAGFGNVRLLKDLLIILTQRTVVLKACGFFLMTMQFFEKICNTTVSYFLLLQSLE